MEIKINNGDQIDAIDLINEFTIPNDECLTPYLKEIFRVRILIKTGFKQEE